MKVSETAEVLTRIAAVHRSTVGKVDVASWHDLIGDLEYDDALEAVRTHYRRSSDWITPAALRAIVRGIREERFERNRPALEAPPADAKNWTKEFHAKVIDLASRRDVNRVLALPAGKGCPPELRDPDAPKRVAGLSVACPWCHAARGEHCVVPATGKRLASAGVHDIRARLAAGEDITADIPQHDPAIPPAPPTTKDKA